MAIGAAQLTRRFGDFTAVKGVNLQIRYGEIYGLLGANGAGKTTTIKAIAGVIPIRSGAVELAGESIGGRPSAEVAARGVAVVPEGRQVFAELTIDDNLRIGAYRIRDRRSIERVRQEVLEIFPVLRQRLRQRAGTLSGGEQQMLAVGRALMLQPKLLLLDEPSMGLAPRVVEQLYVVLRRIVSTGMTALLVEQTAPMALSICTRGYVMTSGQIVYAGAAADLADRALAESYLGAAPPERPA